jgi:hypothetical protein
MALWTASGDCREPQVLDSSPHGGLLTALYLYNGNLYYSEYNQNEVLSVSVDGGAVTGHQRDIGAPWDVVVGEDKIFVLQAQTGGGLWSLPVHSEGLMNLFKVGFGSSNDVVTDDNHVYVTKGSTAFRVPLVRTGTSTVEIVFLGTASSVVRLAMDDDNLFISDSKTGDIFKINKKTLKSSMLAHGLPPAGTWDYFGIPLLTTKGCLYAYAKGTDIIQINKSSGNHNLLLSSNHLLQPGSDAKALYWGEGSSSLIYLKRLDDDGEILEVTTIPYQLYDVKLHSDGSHIYYFVRLLEKMEIYRVSIHGGPHEQIASIDRSAYYGDDPGYYFWASHIISDATDLYWSTSTTFGLVRLPKEGGMPVFLSHALYAYNIASFGDYIYAADLSDHIKRIPKTGQTPPSVEWAQPDYSGAIPEALASDAISLYWAVPTGPWDPDPVDSFDIYTKPITGGTAGKLARLPGYCLKILPYQDRLLVVRYVFSGAGYIGYITAVSKSGGSERDVVTLDLASSPDIYVYDGILYILNGGIYSYNFKTKAIKRLVKGVASANRLYVDKRFIYWTEASTLDYGGVYRTPRLVGLFKTRLYKGLGSFQIVGDDRNIYWNTAWQVLKLPK